MPGVIDVKSELPSRERVLEALESWVRIPGYVRVFGSRYAALVTGKPTEAFADLAKLPDAELIRRFRQRIEEAKIPDTAEVVRQMRAGGMRCVCLHAIQSVEDTDWDYRSSNDRLAALASQHSDFILGFANVNVFDGEAALREVERAKKELGFVGLKVTPLFFKVRSDDPRLMPLYRKCDELGLVIWLHCGNNWNDQTPMDLTHPKYLDRIACQFPNLRIIAGHGGWPWVMDMVVAAWRHRNVYLDISAHRPKYLATPHGGWEPLLHYGNSTICEKVLFGTAWDILGMSLPDMIDEVRHLPLRPEVIERWLHGNAERLFALRDEER